MPLARGYIKIMNTTEFKAWRKRLKLTQDQAAEALGLHKATVQRYDTGKRADGKGVGVPRVVELACERLEMGDG